MRIDGIIEIVLSRGYITIVDAIDADLTEHQWHAHQSNIHVYARRRKHGKNIHLHNVILERKLGRNLEEWEVCDHIDRDSLNNRRSNLRAVTRSQNQRNRNYGGDTPKGVARHGNRWRARIHIGSYDTPEEAHEAYCEAMEYLEEYFNTRKSKRK